MAASLEKTCADSKFKGPEWYTSLAVDFLDFSLTRQRLYTTRIDGPRQARTILQIPPQEG
jgi:hypothetical protein